MVGPWPNIRFLELQSRYLGPDGWSLWQNSQFLVPDSRSLGLTVTVGFWDRTVSLWATWSVSVAAQSVSWTDSRFMGPNSQSLGLDSRSLDRTVGLWSWTAGLCGGRVGPWGQTVRLWGWRVGLKGRTVDLLVGYSVSEAGQSVCGTKWLVFGARWSVSVAEQSVSKAVGQFLVPVNRFFG